MKLQKNMRHLVELELDNDDVEETGLADDFRAILANNSFVGYMSAYRVVKDQAIAWRTLEERETLEYRRDVREFRAWDKFLGV